MAFCSNCGTKLNDGAAFCYACGAPQKPVDGINGQAPAYRAPGAGAETFNRFMNEIFFTVKGMIVAPASTAAEAARRCFKESSFILGGLIMIIQGLLAMWAVAQTVGKLFSSISSSIPGLNMLGGGLMDIIDISYGKIFLYYLLLFIISVGLLYTAMHVFGCYVFKGKGNWMSTWNIVVACALPFTASMLLGIVFGYIYSTLGQVVLLFGVLLALVSQYNGVKQGMELSDNNAAFVVAISNVVSTFITMIILGAVAGSIIPTGF